MDWPILGIYKSRSRSGDMAKGLQLSKQEVAEISFKSTNEFKGGGGGPRCQKSWKYDFEITGDPKGSLSGSTFCSGFKP